MVTSSLPAPTGHNNETSKNERVELYDPWDKFWPARCDPKTSILFRSEKINEKVEANKKG